jgi:hypothetical protein
MNFFPADRCPVCENRLLKRILTIRSDSESWCECQVCEHVFIEPVFQDIAQGFGTGEFPTVFEEDQREFVTALQARFAASQ